ncbi:unnamed protein product [Alopecurus aequalis]
MDAISLDDWELLPDHKSSYFMEECTIGGKDQLLLGSSLVMVSMDYFNPHPGPASPPSPYDCILDGEAKKPHPSPLLQDASEQDPVVGFKEIGVVHTEASPEESASKVTEVQISDAEEEEELIKSPVGEKEVYEDEVTVEAAPDQRDDEGEEGVKGDSAGVECVGFSVGKLKVNGVGALCSFGVAAATFCIFLLGGNGKQQNQKKMQSQKIQFQMYADDERIQQAVEQASMLNQAMSSVMGGASTRASISFGGYYDGF